MTSHCLVDGVGLWAQGGAPATVDRRPILLLDRDGVINIDFGYVGRPDQVQLMPGIAASVACANRAGVPVAIVTNQSGIARGLFGWAEFAEVQHRIDALLAEDGARVDAVFACGYHAVGVGPLALADHDWRKPRPGMLLAALDRLNGDASRSAMVGDKTSDMAAAEAAHVPYRFLVGGASTKVGAIGVATVGEAVDLFLSALSHTHRA